MSLPVYLITGLLGSGKSTCLQHLIQQKPPEQNWALLINEFGEIDIDGAALSASHPNLITETVSGGCICCSAQFNLSQALNQLIQNPDLDALFIEPTGLGHPARIIDTLKQFPQLQLAKTVCVITPQQLTAERWQKSQVMRDLITLADLVLLNKTDLSEPPQIAASEQILDGLYPPKSVLKTQMAQIELATITAKKETVQQAAVFVFQDDSGFSLKPSGAHASQHQDWQSQLPKVMRSALQIDPRNDQILAIGWQFDKQVMFNRTVLKKFFLEFSPFLLRAKGLLRTGNEWQLLNFSDEQLVLSDIAWRQDNRLECLFKENEKIDKDLIKLMETQLLSVISLR
jgi:G3E family GTPase